MNAEILVLCVTAASLGFIHTVLGPDHYLPFIVMSKARKWSLSKTAFITFLCGLGHILSSVLLGLLGVAFGIGVMKLEAFEGFRGNVAGWLLVGFGFAYCIWGMHRALRNRPHSHAHVHDSTIRHVHDHSHVDEHSHVHESQRANITPWVLFTIFVFGPCEPLIPILMYPAAKHSMIGLVLVTVIFGSVTILTMLGIVLAGSWGINLVHFGKTERYAHALAGAAILLSGLAIQFLGL